MGKSRFAGKSKVTGDGKRHASSPLIRPISLFVSAGRLALPVLRLPYALPLLMWAGRLSYGYIVRNRALKNNKASPEPEIPDSLPVTRYDLPARLLHWGHLITFGGLVVTGLAQYFPVLAVLLAGGMDLTMVIHRATGIALVIIPLAFTARYFTRFVPFMAEFATWRPRDFLWLLEFPFYLLFPRRVKLPEVPEKLNPGQKLDGGLLLLTSFLMGISGVLRLFPAQVPAGILARAEIVHQLMFPPVVFFFLGHVFIGSGIHPAYRGVWRSMLGNGRLRAALVKAHWGKWLEREVSRKRQPANAAAGQIRRAGWAVAVAGGVTAVLLLAALSRPFPWQVRWMPRLERMPRGEFLGNVDGQAVRVEVTVANTLKIDLPQGSPVPLSPGQAKRAVIDALVVQR